MAKLIFLPFSVGAGILSGLIGKRLFKAIWGLIDDREPPQPQRRGASLGKLALALGLEGALFRLVRGLVDHTTRRGFAGLTGTWPGDEHPDGTAEPEPGAKPKHKPRTEPKPA